MIDVPKAGNLSAGGGQGEGWRVIKSVLVPNVSRTLYGGWATLSAIDAAVRDVGREFRIVRAPRTGDGDKYLIVGKGAE